MDLHKMRGELRKWEVGSRKKGQVVCGQEVNREVS